MGEFCRGNALCLLLRDDCVPRQWCGVAYCQSLRQIGHPALLLAHAQVKLSTGNRMPYSSAFIKANHRFVKYWNVPVLPT